MRSIQFWKDFYLGSFHIVSDTNKIEVSNDTFNESGLIKTRSFNDLVSVIKQSKETCVRRLSDPSIVYDETKNSTKVKPLFPIMLTETHLDDCLKDQNDKFTQKNYEEAAPTVNGENKTNKNIDETDAGSTVSNFLLPNQDSKLQEFNF